MKLSDTNMIMGELSLDGYYFIGSKELYPSLYRPREGRKEIFLPNQNIKKTPIVHDLEVYVQSIQKIIGFLNQSRSLNPVRFDFQQSFYENLNASPLNIAEVKGQDNLKHTL
ncbi:MAG: hypothetical protein ACMUEM_06705 [Flavobacteriales bacterium AspAUS03]